MSTEKRHPLDHQSNWWPRLRREQPALGEPTLDQQIENLKHIPDDKIDTSDIPEITDWSGSVRGKFYRGPAQPEAGEKPRCQEKWEFQGSTVQCELQDYHLGNHQGTAAVPPAQPVGAREQAEKKVDELFRLRLSRLGFFHANKTLRADLWREIAIGLEIKVEQLRLELADAHLNCPERWIPVSEKLPQDGASQSAKRGRVEMLEAICAGILVMLLFVHARLYDIATAIRERHTSEKERTK